MTDRLDAFALQSGLPDGEGILMNIEERVAKAVELFKSGAACSQAVVGAYADLVGLDMQTAMNASLGFGGGVGRLREICGTVSGMAFLAGLRLGTGDPSDADAKKRVYEAVQTMAAEFREKNGAVVCRELLGLKPDAPAPAQPDVRTPEYYHRRPCAEYVACAAEIAGRRLFCL